jgi:hypothetical protein
MSRKRQYIRFYRTLAVHFPHQSDRAIIRSIFRAESNRKATATAPTTTPSTVRPMRKRYPWPLLWICVLGAWYMLS